MKSFLLIAISFYSSVIFAAEIGIGIQATINSIDIKDQDTNRKIVARMTSDLNFFPTISIISDEYYFSRDSNFGIHFQFDSSVFKANKQDLGGNCTGFNYGTSVSGLALSGVPVVFYHFNRNNPSEWNIKLGTGFGAGYLRLHGNYQVTDITHFEYGKKKQLNMNEVGLAISVYLEIKKIIISFQFETLVR
ncbi:TPA: hypothetical protein ACX3DH_003829 [Vibrio parahaemolyticus]